MLSAPALLPALLYPTPRCASAYFDPSAGGRRGRRGSAPGFRRAVPPGRQGALQRVRAQVAAVPARPEEKAEAAPGGAGGEWGPAAGRAVSRLRQTGADEGGVRRAAAASPRGNDGSVGARCSGPAGRGSGRYEAAWVRLALTKSARRRSGVTSGSRGAEGGRLRGRGTSGWAPPKLKVSTVPGQRAAGAGPGPVGTSWGRAPGVGFCGPGGAGAAFLAVKRRRSAKGPSVTGSWKAL